MKIHNGNQPTKHNLQNSIQNMWRSRGNHMNSASFAWWEAINDEMFENGCKKE